MARIDTTGQQPNSIGIIRSIIQRSIPQGTSENISTPVDHVLAVVDWYESHPQRDYFGDSIIVASTISHQLTRASFIPVSRIIARCAYIETSYKFNYGEDRIMVCIPLLKRF